MYIVIIDFMLLFVGCYLFSFFFFKQKTAYELRISDWSSDVCSSDLGGLIFGMTAALFGDITVAKGRVQQGNFNDYRAVRINEAPRVEIHLVKSSEDPGGIGEPPTTAAPPAIAPALAAATGIRLRRSEQDRSEPQSLLPLSHAAYRLKK